jgi:release factor glutamine methyltransferase
MYSQEVNWLLFEKYQGEKNAAFLADCARLQAGVPLAYLIGHIPFLTASIYLDSHPLIPRPETEFWLEKALIEIKEADKEIEVLDLCAGSGAIGVAVLKKQQNSRVTFIEIDSSHLPTIAKNCNANEIDSNRVTIIEGDIFETNVELPKFDFILSNPPYIDKILGRTELSVVENEPALALYGGISGMEIITRIIKESPLHLKPGGQLWIEHEPEQTTLIKNIAEGIFITNTYRDQYQIERFSKLVLQ